MAVPMTVKMPEPMTMPTPSAVSETGPSDFFSACSGSSESEMSLSMDLVAKIWRGRALSSSGEIYRIAMIVRANEIAAKRNGDRSSVLWPPFDVLDAYRLEAPRAAFLTFCLFSPRAPVRGPLGGAALRAARFTFLRSSFSVIDFVFAMMYVFSLMLKFCRRKRKRTSAAKAGCVPTCGVTAKIHSTSLRTTYRNLIL
jgi:hypothetical protein